MLNTKLVELAKASTSTVELSSNQHFSDGFPALSLLPKLTDRQSDQSEYSDSNFRVEFQPAVRRRNPALSLLPKLTDRQATSQSTRTPTD